MSISSTGLYGSATIVNTDIFDDLLTLKEEVTALSTVDLTTTNEHRIDILQNKQDITDIKGKITLSFASPEKENLYIYIYDVITWNFFVKLSEHYYYRARPYLFPVYFLAEAPASVAVISDASLPPSALFSPCYGRDSRPP